ncbi:aminotransferase class I/II-fold pyridoxal phosphate-dependent enzyme [Thiotrichales bacterium 19S3-7]|nr:aminotransferase class I/II-fold pyridoxal phosphate-dependent enzyme [Thiotrichales bacterium 19S3-7]MCF6802631.1 aminotransferase class I/II-fold pyridoxal phosphate-dependent enzyme [Thiotrichales bacterium 19S3-11]
MTNWFEKKINNSELAQTTASDSVNNTIYRKRLKRHLVLNNGTKLIDFVSCSYLGLDQDPRILKACSQGIYETGFTYPAARTRIQPSEFLILEELLNKIYCQSYSTVFSSLHLGHLGILPLLASGKMPSFQAAKNGFCFILDKTVHSSLQIHRALMQQFGDVILTDFTNTNKLEYYFINSVKLHKTPIAIADSIGSMGGKQDIPYLFDLAEKYNGYIYLDDAHGMSIFGKNGCGYVLKSLNYSFHPRLILTSSLAKAFGSVAGVVVLPTKKDTDMFRRYAPTYVFSGPPAIPVINAAIASAHIHLSSEILTLQNQLKQNIQYFDRLLNHQNIINSDTAIPIRGILIGDELTTIEAAKFLKNNGVAITTALYPTVAKNKAMLRIAISSNHTKSDMHQLCELITNLTNKHVVKQT